MLCAGRRQTLKLHAQDSMKDFQELADEAFMAFVAPF
jgi:hypothetical protein